MAQEQFAGTAPSSLVAGGAISQYAALKLSAGTVVVAAAITDQVIGVAMQSASLGEACGFLSVSGTICLMRANAAIAAGAEVMPAAGGNVATSAGATAVSCGIAIDAAANALDLIRVLFRPSVKSPANV
jgi:Uncharacterized conserved protein (DUF2190)